MIKREQGFTLVELVIAMAIFAFMSVILAAGIVRLFQIYEAGTAIRVSEQSASAVAQKITRDAQKVQVLAAGPPPSTVPASIAANFSTICVMVPETPTASSETLDGSVYFVNDNTSGGYVINKDQIGIYQKDAYQMTAVPIQAGNSVPTQAALNAACIPPTTGVTGAQPISGSDTSAIAFSATVDNPGGSVPLLSTKLDMAADTDLINVDPNSVPGNGLCLNGKQARYCSVTNLTITAGTRGGAQ